MAVFQNRAELEQVKEEPTWSVEAINACWTNGWKRLEVTGAIAKALEENKAKFDHLVDNVKTADARARRSPSWPKDRKTKRSG